MAPGSDDLMSLLLVFLPQIPQFLVWIVAMILAFVFWSRYPRVCLLTLLASILLLVRSVVVMLLYFYLPRMHMEQGRGIESLQRTFTIVRIVDALVSTGAWVMIIFAIFGWRKQRRALEPDDEPIMRPRSVGDYPREDLPPSAFRE